MYWGSAGSAASARPCCRTGPTDTAGAMGACLEARRSHWDRLGGLYEPYFANHEDADFSIRTWRLGQRVVSVVRTLARHNYGVRPQPEKFYIVERNRLLFVSTVWSGRALLGVGAGPARAGGAHGGLAVKDGWIWLKGVPLLGLAVAQPAHRAGTPARSRPSG